MMKKILFLLLCLCTAAIQADVYNVKDYGAKADGKTIDSPAINRAIQEAAANGGGTVYLPAGNYACYSIRLASHVHLLMEQGTVITAAFPSATEGYDEAEANEHNRYQDFGHSHWKNSLIWGIGLEDIVISNITMRDIVNSPIFLRLGARMRSPEGTPVGSMKRILISNINVFNADSRYSSIISGIPGAIIEDVSLSNIHIYHQGGYTEADGQRTPPEQEKVYPEPWMFGTVPAKGFYIRHARNIRLDNVHFHYEQPDGRPLMVTDDAIGIAYRNITSDGKVYEP